MCVSVGCNFSLLQFREARLRTLCDLGSIRYLDEYLGMTLTFNSRSFVTMHNVKKLQKAYLVTKIQNDKPTNGAQICSMPCTVRVKFPGIQQ